jgi:hypothetical protein
MGDLTARKKRLESYRRFLKSLRKRNFDPEYLKRFPGYDPASLKAAAIYFGLDLANPSHLSMLTHILADLEFGKRRPGRQKGDATTWDEGKWWTLALTYQKLKSRHPGYKGDMAKKICETPEFKPYKNNPEQIRQKLSEVRRALSDDAEVEIFESVFREGEPD